MKINTFVIAVVIISIIAFFYFIIKRNRKDRKELEQELNQKEIKPEKHDEEQV